MLRNPDLAIPLYVLVVISGILLGGKWRTVVDTISKVKVA